MNKDYKLAEKRLINLAQIVADKYKEELVPAKYKEMCKAIEVCNEYHLGIRDNWVDMADVVLGENGLWVYAMEEEELWEPWMLLNNILSCNCYIGCVEAGNIYPPQDLELQEENLLEFVDLLEKSIGKDIDYDAIWDFWEGKICY